MTGLTTASAAACLLYWRPWHSCCCNKPAAVGTTIAAAAVCSAVAAGAGVTAARRSPRLLLQDEDREGTVVVQLRACWLHNTTQRGHSRTSPVGNSVHGVVDDDLAMVGNDNLAGNRAWQS